MLDHVVHIDAMSTGLIDVFRTALEASNLLEQQRQANVTRQLAAWGGIIAVPSAIAGIYGMNFANLPATQTSWGYWAILGLMAGICGLLYWRFRRLGWLRPARTRQAPVTFVGRRSQISRKLRTCGFKVRGATMVRARMRALRLVNDHEPGCFRVSGLTPS